MFPQGLAFPFYSEDHLALATPGSQPEWPGAAGAGASGSRAPALKVGATQSPTSPPHLSPWPNPGMATLGKSKKPEAVAAKAGPALSHSRGGSRGAEKLSNFHKVTQPTTELWHGECPKQTK